MTHHYSWANILYYAAASFPQEKGNGRDFTEKAEKSIIFNNINKIDLIFDPSRKPEVILFLTFMGIMMLIHNYRNSLFCAGALLLMLSFC